MSDHLGEWYCETCGYRAPSSFLWKKHRDNFHNGIDPRPAAPMAGYVECFVCANAAADVSTGCPTIPSLVEHIENRHYSMLTAIPLAWSEGIYLGAVKLLAFEAWCHEHGRAA